MHDAIFEDIGALEDGDFEGYATRIGISVDRYKSCYGANKFKSKIQRDQRTAITLGAGGTPAFFINGRFIGGAQPYSTFQTLIDEELKKAKESGVPKADYYAREIIGKGQKAL